MTLSWESAEANELMLSVQERLYKAGVMAVYGALVDEDKKRWLRSTQRLSDSGNALFATLAPLHDRLANELQVVNHAEAWIAPYRVNSSSGDTSLMLGKVNSKGEILSGSQIVMAGLYDGQLSPTRSVEPKHAELVLATAAELEAAGLVVIDRS